MIAGADRLVAGRVAELRLPGSRPLTTADELDVDVTGPDGATRRFPAFRVDAATWAIRFLPESPGPHAYRAHLSGALFFRSGEGEGQVEVEDAPGTGGADRMPLPVSVEQGSQRFVDAAGEPFLWLGDTWWYALSDRISDAQLARLARKRVAEGFTVVQLVAGLYPEISPLDAARGRSGGRLPWDDTWTDLDLGFFEHMDRRLGIILRAGLVPSIFGAWGYYLSTTGISVMKRHWRELVARYAAYPVTWSVAGEATLPWYDLPFKPESKPFEAELAAGWLEIARYVRRIDPYRRPLSAHPSPGTLAWSTTDMFDDPGVIDHVMLQTGHWERANYKVSLDTLHRELEREPRRPVLNTEVCYEGIAGSNWPDAQRFLFWTHMLSGAAGHTYGAQGLWAMNDGTYVGRMGRWGSATWREASELPGAVHVGAGGLWLRERPWASLRYTPGIVEPHASEGDRIGPHAATLEDGRRVIYFPIPALVEGDVAAGFKYALIRLQELPADGEVRLDWYDPRSFELFESAIARADAHGVVEIRETEICALPSMEDWVLEVTRLSR
ncbi:hypothetical protein BH24CHL9_BH24CHL9_02900 [soil metagenome]